MVVLINKYYITILVVVFGTLLLANFLVAYEFIRTSVLKIWKWEGHAQVYQQHDDRSTCSPQC